MKYEIRSYSGSLKCRIDNYVAESIFNAAVGHFRPHRTSAENVYQIDKDVEFQIDSSFVLYLWGGDLIFESKYFK